MSTISESNANKRKKNSNKNNRKNYGFLELENNEKKSKILSNIVIIVLFIVTICFNSYSLLLDNKQITKTQYDSA